MLFQTVPNILLFQPNSPLHKINKNQYPWKTIYKLYITIQFSLSFSLSPTTFWSFKGVTRDTRSWCRGKSVRTESSCRTKYLITSSVPSTRRRIEGAARSRTTPFTTVWKSARRIIISSYGRIPASLPQASRTLRQQTRFVFALISVSTFFFPRFEFRKFSKRREMQRTFRDWSTGAVIEEHRRPAGGGGVRNSDDNLLKDAKLREMRDSQCHYLGRVHGHSGDSALSTCYGLVSPTFSSHRPVVWNLEKKYT